ncbi:MAG: glycosyltransferase family 9 protein [Candidatus Schmidhempelia sp.]|nr:glycosyltransferase family 9 protein [Candidatus Schmidhempelia sp.]
MKQSLKQTIRELNWKRNFATKRLRLRLRFSFYNLIKFLFIRRYKQYNLESIKKILIIRNDRIGDMVATTGLIRNLAISGYEVYVSSRKQSLAIIKHNPYVKGVFIYDDSNIKNLYKSIKEARKEKFDLAIETRFNRFLDIHNLVFCSFMRTNILAGFCKSNISSFNLSINYYHPNNHVTSQLIRILDLLDIRDKSVDYELFVSDDIKNKADSFLSNLNNKKKIVIFNPYGSQQERCMNDNHIKLLYNLLEKTYQVILIGEAVKLNSLKLADEVKTFNSTSVLDIIPLIEKADLVVSVDTAVVHIATCFNKKTLAFYINTVPKEPQRSNKKAYYNYQLLILKAELEDYFQDKNYINKHNPDRTILINHNVWSPNNKNAIQIILDFDPIRNTPNNILEQKTIEALNRLVWY